MLKYVGLVVITCWICFCPSTIIQYITQITTCSYTWLLNWVQFVSELLPAANRCKKLIHIRNAELDFLPRLADLTVFTAFHIVVRIHTLGPFASCWGFVSFKSDSVNCGGVCHTDWTLEATSFILTPCSEVSIHMWLQDFWNDCIVHSLNCTLMLVSVYLITPFLLQQSVPIMSSALPLVQNITNS